MTKGRLIAWITAAALLLPLLCSVAAAWEPDDVLGSVENPLTATGDNDARCTESTLADAAADAVRFIADAEIVILPGGCFADDLSVGDLTYATLVSAVPEGEELAGAWVTCEQLWQILEAGFSHIALDEAAHLDFEASAFDGYPQVSGMSIRCDASAPAWERVLEVYLEDETELTRSEPDMQLYLVSTEAGLSGEYGGDAVTYEPLGLTLTEALAQYVDYTKRLARPDDTERVHRIGTTDNSFLSPLNYSQWLFVILIVLLFLLAAAFHGAPLRERMRELRTAMDRDTQESREDRQMRKQRRRER